MLILVIYYKKFDSDCQSHSDDSINLKGLSVLKTSPFLFISRSFFIRTISIQFIVSLLPIYFSENIDHLWQGASWFIISPFIFFK